MDKIFKIVHSLVLYIKSRFRSHLTEKFGESKKQRSIVYSGRGRPPKGTITPLAEGGGDSSEEEEDTRQSAAVPVPLVETEVEDKDIDFSEEETTEAVSFTLGLGYRGTF